MLYSVHTAAAAGIINHIVYSGWRFAMKVETNQVESGRLDKSRALGAVY